MSEAQQLKAEGNAAYSAGNNAEAVKCFTRAIELDPSDHVFFSNRSAAYAAMGDYESALKDAESCVNLAPQWSKAYSRLGLALFNLNRLDGAKKAYEQGLAIEPENSILKSGLADVEAALEAPAKNPFDQLFGQDIWGRIQSNPMLSPFLADSSFVNKVQMLQKNPSLITSMLNDPKIQALFGALLGMDTSAFSSDGQPSENDRSEDAPKGEEQTNAQEVSEPEQEVRQSLAEKESGNSAYKKRDFASALAHYEKAVNLDPKNPVLLLNIAAVKLETGAFDEAISQCTTCIEKCQELEGQLAVIAKAYARIGTAHQKMGDLDRAIEFFERSLIENHDRAVDKKLKEIRNAVQEKARLAYLDKGKAIEHREKGNVLFQGGKFTDAITEYDEAIKRNPDDHRSFSNRAACYTKLMDWSKALDDVNKAIALDPKFVKAYIRKAKIEIFLKQYHKARDTCKAGLDLEPDCSDLLQSLHEVEIAVRNESMSGEIDPERQARAMADPEVQKIMQDPQLQTVLQQIQSDPHLAAKAMNDPAIRSKIQVLIDAGILRTK